MSVSHAMTVAAVFEPRVCIAAFSYDRTGTNPRFGPASLGGGCQLTFIPRYGVTGKSAYGRFRGQADTDPPQLADDNKSGLYRQCAGAGKSGTRQTARAGALSIRPVVLKPRWFGMAIAFWRIDQNEAEMFRRAEPARSDCGAPGIPGEWLGTTALCRLTGPVNVKIIANRVVRVLPRAASNREIPVRAHG